MLKWLCSIESFIGFFNIVFTILFIFCPFLNTLSVVHTALSSKAKGPRFDPQSHQVHAVYVLVKSLEPKVLCSTTSSYYAYKRLGKFMPKLQRQWWIPSLFLTGAAIYYIMLASVVGTCVGLVTLGICC